MKKTIYWLGAAALSMTFYACTKAEASEGAFEYRGVYLPDTNGETSKSLNLNNIDDDWGIWGHNLDVVLPERHSHTVYAKVDGDTDNSQFCFTNDYLFDYICDYITDNYGWEEGMKFAILPNDNAIVCTCQNCRLVGNTAQNASPAVFEMIDRLAEKFPKHTFFTSYYYTTKGLPTQKMPSNTGVLISAMDYPRTMASTPQEGEFRSLIESWAAHTNHVYIWDYVNNFDDYYTPAPILGIMQNRLKMYRDAGVRGVFLNGSGEDYSTFSGVKKRVLAKLLHDPEIDWREELRAACKDYYPVAGNLIAEYMIGQEDFIASGGKTLPMYDGIKETIGTYLDREEFIKFHDELMRLLPETSGSERKELENVAKALAFTRLELMRNSGDITDAQKYLDILGQTDDVIRDYGEAYWPVEAYVKEFRFLKDHYDKESKNSLLKGVKLSPRTKLDPDYSDISIVTDGLLGIPSNYHSGNLISSAETLTLDVPHQTGMKRLKVWFVKNDHFKIGLPTDVMLKIGGLKYDLQTPPEVSGREGHSAVEFVIPAEAHGMITLLVNKDPDIKTMAIDEIEAYSY